MKTLHSESGFTLIEALVAIAVLSIGIFALYSMQITAVSGNARANRLTTASSMATDSYERLLQMAYNDPALDATANPHDYQTDFGGVPPLPALVTSINWNVTEWTNGDGIDNDGDGDTDEGDETGIKLVGVTVNYNFKGAKTLTMNFYKHELF